MARSFSQRESHETLSRIGVGPVAKKGRGVIAYRYIHAGEHLERAHTIELDKTDTAGLAATCLDDYYFAHPGDPDGGLLVLGLASLCNHSEDPNVRAIARKDAPVGWVVEMRALRDIKPGEELTRRYACDLWFETED